VFVGPGSTTLLALVAHLHVIPTTYRSRQISTTSFKAKDVVEIPFKANLDNILQGNALFTIVVITVFFAIFKMSRSFFHYSTSSYFCIATRISTLQPPVKTTAK
jgi:hypothetical protein